MGDAEPSFACPQCGTTHAGFPKDYGYTLPDEVWAIPQGERALQAKFTRDLCRFGDRYFIRCLLAVPFVGADDYFGWGLWVETARSVFERYVALYNQDASAEPPYTATIANRPPLYADALGAEVLIQFGPSKERPTIYFPPGASSTLAAEQRQGIDPARYHEVLEAIGAM
ncbi:MAG TPA: DUF2199 domain-containing protein [Stellaceae bacterium]